MISQIWLDQERQAAAVWARDLLRREFVIFDGETTGTQADDEFVQVGAIDQTGAVLIDQLVQPRKAISPGAEAVHGISSEALRDAPTFEAVYPALQNALAGRLVIAYNADFDRMILTGTCWMYHLPMIEIEGWECAMKQYARFYGDWQPRRRSFRWVRLAQACLHEGVTVEGAHTAAGDCLLTLRLIEVMAQASG